MTIKIQPGKEMVATDHQVGDHVLMTEQGHLEGGNRQGPDPTLGAVLVKG